MRLVALSLAGAVLGGCGITDAESDVAIELRQWRIISAENSQSWLEVRYLAINNTDDAGELDYCCTQAFLTPGGQADGVTLQYPCMRLCVSGPDIAPRQTMTRTMVFSVPAPGEYRLGVAYQLPHSSMPRIGWSRTFNIR